MKKKLKNRKNNLSIKNSSDKLSTAEDINELRALVGFPPINSDQEKHI